MPSKANVQDIDVALWISLHFIPGLGNAGICQLLAKFGSPEAIYNAKSHQLKEVVDDEVAQKILNAVDTDLIQPTLNWLDKDDAHIVPLPTKIILNVY